MKNTKNRFGTLFALIITLIIFYIIFTKIELTSLVDILSHANFSILMISLLPMILALFIQAKRWQTILETMGGSIPYIQCFKILMASFALTSITPSKAGDVVRALYLKDKLSITKTIGSVLTERVFDLFTLVAFSLIGIIIYKKHEYVSPIIGFSLILLLFIITITKSSHLPIKKSWVKKLQNIIISMRSLSLNKKSLLTVIVYSIIIWFLAIIQTTFFFYALGINIPISFVIGNIPIAIFVGMIPISLGGMGTRDAAIIVLFSDYATTSQLLGVGILFSAFRYWLLSLIGVIFMKKMMK